MVHSIVYDLQSLSRFFGKTRGTRLAEVRQVQLARSELAVCAQHQ
jgi:hypothetical protein